MKLLAVIAMFAIPPLIGIALALIQWAIYRALVGIGRIASDDVPIFLFLFLRGMLVVLVLGGAAMIWKTVSEGPPGRSAGHESGAR